jgi:hypothetical protein
MQPDAIEAFQARARSRNELADASRYDTPIEMLLGICSCTPGYD